MIAHEHLRIAREYEQHISGVSIFTEIERELSDYDFDAEIYLDYMTMLFFEPIILVAECKAYIEKHFSIKVDYCLFDNDEHEIVSDLEPTDEVYGLIVRQ